MQAPARIAHVTATFPPYWGGTGNVAFHHARVLHERGHDVTVITAATTGRSTGPFPFGVEYLRAPLQVGNAPFTPRLMRRLSRFDLIHLHYPYIFGTELVLAAARRHRIPIVLSYHNQLSDRHPIKQALFQLYNRLVEPTALRQSALLLPVRAAHLYSCHPCLAGDRRIHEIPNGVDTELFRPMKREEARQALGLTPHVPLALFVGALDTAHRFKNVDGLLHAIATLDLPDAQLLIVGDGNVRVSLETLARHLCVADRVRFLGSRPPEQLPTLYSAADALILPSTGVEAFPLVLLEAMACGTPPIATRLSGIKTLIEDGMDGLLIPPGDTDAISSALASLLSAPQQAAAMGRRGREKVVREYAWPAIGARLEQLYGEVLQA